MPAKAPDYLFIDAILLAYHLGAVRYEEQKVALWSAARRATDAFSFLTAMDMSGVGRRTQLYSQIGKFLSSPTYYRAQYKQVLGLHGEGEEAESFLDNPRVLSLLEPVLTSKQQKLFYDAYWWFSHNHQPMFTDLKKGRHVGVYATDPKDNASVMERFEAYLNYLQNHKTQKIRQQFEDLPADVVLAILKRAFL